MLFFLFFTKTLSRSSESGTIHLNNVSTITRTIMNRTVSINVIRKKRVWGEVNAGDGFPFRT